MTETRLDRMIGGRYRLVERLGSGGFGRVWKARDETLGVDVAIKQVWLPPAASVADHAQRLARAEREARNAARLRDHPNIVTLYDVVIDDEVPWTVMRLVTGGSLQEHLDTHGALTVEVTANVAGAVLNALSAAHEAGIVHRDVKPANVMLTDGGEVLLTDFGIAVHQADTALTGTGTLVGSVEYAAPERLRGTDGLAASDLFSLGVTLYQAVEGLSPFHRDTPTGSLAAVLFDQAPEPQRAGRLAPLITRLLEKDPDKRGTIPEALALIDTPPTTPTKKLTVTTHHDPAGVPEEKPFDQEHGATTPTSTPSGDPSAPSYNYDYGQPGYPPRPPGQGRTNGLAVASLVLGILWVFWIGSILALIFGYIARTQIRDRNEGGAGLAMAGIVLGWVGVGTLALYTIVMVYFVAPALPTIPRSLG